MALLLAVTLALAATVAGSPNAIKRAACDADNCARLVTGTQAGLPSTRLADCSSFMTSTVTPVPVYTTITKTSTHLIESYSTITTNPVYLSPTTVTTTINSVYHPPATNSTSLAKRVVPITTNGTAPTNAGTATATSASPPRPTVPSYAQSECPSDSRYSSACSCAGITTGTTTLPQKTITITSSVTVSPTTTIFTAATTTIQSTVTATTTAVETGLPCGAKLQGDCCYSAKYITVRCGQRVGNTTVPVQGEAVYPTEKECLNACTGDKYCMYAAYQFSTGLCRQYYKKPTELVPDADWDGLVWDL